MWSYQKKVKTLISFPRNSQIVLGEKEPKRNEAFTSDKTVSIRDFISDALK